MNIHLFLQKIKKKIGYFLIPTVWPWEIISGLLIVILLVNNIKDIFGASMPSRITFVYFIIAINIFWGLMDGLMFIFSALLERGRYNTMLRSFKTADKKAVIETLGNELSQVPIIYNLDKKTKADITEKIIKQSSSVSLDSLKKPKIYLEDIIGMLFTIFFVFLPCIITLPFLLLIKDFGLAVLTLNIISLILLVAFGYKLASCINRNKTLTSILFIFIGIAIITIGSILGA